MASLALVFSTMSLLLSMLAFLQVLPFSRGFRAVESWLWARQINKLERSLDEGQKGRSEEGNPGPSS